MDSEHLSDISNIKEERALEEIVAKNKEKERRFAEEGIGKLIFSFSTPAIVGMLVSAVYNIVDSFYIGRAIGTSGTGALNFVFPINIVSLALMLLFSAGGAALYSIKMGQRKYADAGRVMSNSFIGAIAVALVLGVVALLFLREILLLFGTTQVAMQPAYDYMFIVACGLPLFGVGIWGNNFMRATGRPLLSMASILIGGIINFILDPIFIFALDMGMKGAAYATVCGQFVSALWVLAHFLLPKARIRLKLVKPSPKFLWSIAKYGFPFFVFQCANSLVQFTINRTIVQYAGITLADDAIAAMGALQKFQTIIYMPISGLSQGIVPIMAFNYGAKRLDRSNRVFLTATMWATAVGVIGFIVAQSIPRGIVYAFVPNASDQYYQIGEHIIRCWSLGYPLLGYLLAVNYFTATGKPNYSAFLSLLRQVIVFVPAVLLFPFMWGFEAIFYANPVADVIIFVVVAVSLFVTIRGINKRAKISEAVQGEAEDMEKAVQG